MGGARAGTPAWASVGVTTLGVPWRCSSSRTVCLTEFKKAAITSELVVDWPVSPIELPGMLDPDPDGVSVAAASGAAVESSVSRLSMMITDECLSHEG